MRIHGRTEFHRSELITITLGDGDAITAKLDVPSVDIGDVLLERLPVPRPPRRVLKDGKGVVFNPKTGEPVRLSEDEDKAYRKKKSEHDTLFAIASFLFMLNDPDWIFDAEEPPADAAPDAWQDFYGAVYGEMRAAGFPVSAFRQIARKMGELTGVSEKDIEEAEAAFA